MPKEENLEVVREFFERVLNSGDMSSLAILSHRDVAVPQSTPGIEGLSRLLEEARATFANPEYKILDTVCEGDKVVVRFSGRGTHAGRFMGIPASGRMLKLWGVMIFRFQAGAIAEFWSLMDAQDVLKQLRNA